MSKRTPEQEDQFTLNVAKDVQKCVHDCVLLINATIEKHSTSIRWNIAGRIVTRLWAVVYKPTIETTFKDPDILEMQIDEKIKD